MSLEKTFFGPLLSLQENFRRAFYNDNINHVINRAVASKTRLVTKPKIALAVSRSLQEIKTVNIARTMPAGNVQCNLKLSNNDACQDVGFSGSWVRIAISGQTTPAKIERKTNATA
jgi:hypothetical protein